MARQKYLYVGLFYDDWLDAVSYPKRMQHYTLKSIQDSKGCPVGRKKDEFAIVAELDSRPLTGPVVLKLEGCKGTLSTS